MMLTKEQIKEIKDSLQRSQNPVFFFDNDQDGLCSFLLLQRYLGRGKGVAVRSFPDLDGSYFRKVSELGADYIFILDKPTVSEKFWEEVEKYNLPVIWIDHHKIEGQKIPEFVNYYNPACNKDESNEPVTAICYGITERREDLWLAIIGCVADSYLPDFYPDFLKKYPELGIETESAFEVLYNSRIGEIARMLGNGLKDKTTNVVNMQRFLMKINSPYDVLEENNKTYLIHKRSKEIDAKYQKLLNEAKKCLDEKGKLLFFRYSGDLSISGELSNELIYRFPEKVIVVAYVRGTKVNLSLRGKDIKNKFLKVLEGIEHATGGGHKDAVGGVLQSKDLDEFKRELEKLI